MEAAQKGCAGPPLHLRKDSRLCKQKLQKHVDFMKTTQLLDNQQKKDLNLQKK